MSQPVEYLLEHLNTAKLIGIVRTGREEEAVWASQILIEAGVRWIEIPFTVPQAHQVIEQLAEAFPQAIIGAGTVLEAKDAVQALGAGAQFLVSPVLNEPLIQLGLEHDILVMPGCMTPTEIHKAWGLGAPAIKFFPAQPLGGAEFLAAVRAPLPQIPLVATGGIALAHVPGYLQAGALAVGVGGPLIPAQAIADRDEKRIRTLATSYLEAVSAFINPAPVA